MRCLSLGYNDTKTLEYEWIYIFIFRLSPAEDVKTMQLRLLSTAGMLYVQNVLTQFMY